MGVLTTKKALAGLTLRLGELSTDVRELKSAQKHLELEWEELYDKVRHQMARMSRRAKADTPEWPDETVNAEGADGADRVDPISAGILRRRNTGGIPR